MWIDIPEVIKLKRSQMSAVHFSDVLRLLLLRKYGGVWIDATVLLTGKPEWFPNEEFFCFTRNRDPRILATWWIEARSHSYLLNGRLDLLLCFWEEHESVADYFLMHHIFESLYFLNDDFRTQWDSVTFRPADPPHLLQSALSLQYSPEEFQAILWETNVHKLTWKITEEIQEDSIYNYILNSQS